MEFEIVLLLLMIDGDCRALCPGHSLKLCPYTSASVAIANNLPGANVFFGKLL